MSAGVRLPLEVNFTGPRGWGVRCKRDIQSGQFVAEYVGELVTSMEAVRAALVLDRAQAAFLGWVYVLAKANLDLYINLKQHMFGAGHPTALAQGAPGAVLPRKPGRVLISGAC